MVVTISLLPIDFISLYFPLALLTTTILVESERLCFLYTSGAKLLVFLHFHSTISEIIIVICEWKIKKRFQKIVLLYYFGCSTATIIGRNNIMLPTRPVEFIWGTTNPLTIGISAENQWVCLFCCQS